MVDLNKFAEEVTSEEGLKEQVNIAQVKEIQGIIFKKLAKLPPEEVQGILDRYKGESGGN